MKLYLYNCNHKNEFLEEINTNTPLRWEGCSTDLKPVRCNIVGKSYAFNPSTNAWDVLIDDWRGVTLYKKSDSRVKKMNLTITKMVNFSLVTPPDNEKQYIWNEGTSSWQEYVLTINPKVVLKRYLNAIQNFIDRVAQDRGYDNGYTCASYYEDINPRYASDAKIFKDWRSRVWTQVNIILNQYSSQVEGQDQIPVSILDNYPSAEDIISQLPQILWEEI